MAIGPEAFPPLPTSSYGPEQLMGYLAGVVVQGHSVYRDPGHQNIFYIPISESHRIRISVAVGHSQVQLQYLTNIQSWLDVSSLADLERAVANLSEKVGVQWPSRPTTGRLDVKTPAENYRTISGLIGSRRVTAVFDPYLDNKTLVELQIILSFGDGKFANGVRLLGGAEKSQGTSPTFTAEGVTTWLTQLGIAGEARVLPPKSEHRRFLLLDDGHVLITGHSLNSPHKNEAVSVVPSDDDRAFFNVTWASASLLVAKAMP